VDRLIEQKSQKIPHHCNNFHDLNQNSVVQCNLK